jgi:hypothetical protein
VQVESPKHLHQTIFETLKYLQQCFETAYLGENAINLLQQKVAQNVTIFGTTSSFQKGTMSLQKLAKNHPISSPWLSSKHNNDVFS